MNMKKIALVTLILALTTALLLSGCGLIAPKQQGGIKTSDGEIVVGENVKWPDADMGGLAKPSATVTAVIKDNISGGCSVAFSEMTADAAASYVAGLKQQGYQAVLDMTDTDGLFFTGSKADGAAVAFTYTNSAKEGTLTYTPAQDGVSGVTTVSEQTGTSAQTGTSNQTGTSLPDESETQEPIDMTDVSPWPSNFIAGVPELKGKITNVSNQNNENMTVELAYVEKADFEAYVATLKKNGYTVDVDEGKDSYNYDFRAYNENGDYVNAYMSYEGKTATVYMEKAVKE